MKQSLHQSAVMRQDMRMNPRLYQAMDLLYMPLLDLQQHLKTELLSNPFLELVEDEEELAPDVSPAEEQEKEREEKEKEDEIDWEDVLMDGFQVGGARQEYEEREVLERVPVSIGNLADHLREQIHLADYEPRDQLLAEEFIGNIGDDGYLKASIEDIVRGANRLVFEMLSQEDTNGDHAPEDHPDAAVAEPQTPVEEPHDLAPSAVGPLMLGDRVDAVEWIGTGEFPAATDVAEEVAVAAPTSEPAPMVDKTEEGPEQESLIPEDAEDMDVPWFTVFEAERLLHRLQKLDPPGVAARDLRECLLLQLADQGLEDSLTFRLVDEAFDDLIQHRWSDLAKRYSLDPKEVQDAADELARFDPKPGLRFQSTDDGYVTPDLVMDKIDGEYRIFLNDTGMPRLRISRIYQELAGDKKKFKGENRDFITSKLNSATWLIQAIEQRRQTMLKVMNFIVDRQREFFEKGVEHLKPLTLREVADVINMHESTVSRVTNQKYVQTPRGVLPLKFFFSSSLGTASGEDASARSVKAQIRKLVDDEDTTKPLTDSDLVKALQARGIKIARRTVAKYRDQLGILPARMRKRV